MVVETCSSASAMREMITLGVKRSGRDCRASQAVEARVKTEALSIMAIDKGSEEGVPFGRCKARVFRRWFRRRGEVVV